MNATLKALIYGDTGAGKTYLLGTFTQNEATWPVLVLNARGQPITFRLFEDPPLVIEVDSMKAFNDPYVWIRDGQSYEALNNAGHPIFGRILDYFHDRGLSPEESKFKTICVDSITHTQRVAKAAIVGNAAVLPGDMPKQAQIQHWGRTLDQITNLTDLYFKLPINVIMTALCRRQTVEALGQVLYSPFLWGQGALEVPSHAEMIGRLVPITSLKAQQVTQVKAATKQMDGPEPFNALLTRAGSDYIAKWQGVLDPPDLIINPSATKLLGFLR